MEMPVFGIFKENFWSVAKSKIGFRYNQVYDAFKFIYDNISVPYTTLCHHRVNVDKLDISNNDQKEIKDNVHYHLDNCNTKRIELFKKDHIYAVCKVKTLVSCSSCHLISEWKHLYTLTPSFKVHRGSN